MNGSTKHENTIAVADVKWDPSIYPRDSWNTSTIQRYADSIEAGEVFPPIILEKSTNRLLDGKHRLEAHKKAERETIRAEWHSVPSDVSAKYYAATLSARHGDRLSNADIKKLAEDEFDANPGLDVQKWGKGLGVSKSSVYRWVSHIIEREKRLRATKAWRLSMLGWSQEEIGEMFGVEQKTICLDIQNSQLGKMYNTLGSDWNEKGIAELAQRLELSLTDCYASAMTKLSDSERLEKLNINLQPYDAWHFTSCHEFMGDSHPGRIPGQLVAHVLYFFTQPGQVIVDPMAGSGTTLDASLLMGRKCFGFDADLRHDRCDIIKNDLATSGWPAQTKKANLIFWDPPYFSKMDDDNVKDGYGDDSISKLDRKGYLAFFLEQLKSAYSIVKPGTLLAFLMSDWDDEKGEQDGIFIWDYADVLRKTGWQIIRHIQTPLSTQQVHPDIVNKFRKSKRLARLERYLLIAKK